MGQRNSYETTLIREDIKTLLIVYNGNDNYTPYIQIDYYTTTKKRNDYEVLLLHPKIFYRMQ